MIDITQADRYFRAGNHTQASVWASFSSDARLSALAEAKRMLARALRRSLNESLSEYQPGDVCREDFAVFEQALFLLKKGGGAIVGGYSATPAAVPVTEDQDAEPEKTFAGGICEAAILWLGIPAVASVRG